MGGPFDADAEAHFDEVAEAFAKLTNVDRDVGVDLEKELCMTVEADDRSDALVTRRLFRAYRGAYRWRRDWHLGQLAAQASGIR